MTRALHEDPDADSTAAFYDRISTIYDLIAASERPCRERGLEALAAAAGERVLEIGSGTGHGLADLARAVGAAGGVEGIDLSAGMLEVARKHLAREGLGDRVRLRRGDARSLPYGADRFDAVFLAFTLEIFAAGEIPRVLAEVRRVLRPGGRLGLVAMAAREHPGALARVYGWLHRRFPHWVDCAAIDAAGVVSAAGFRIREVVETSVSGLPVDVVVGVAPEEKERFRFPKRKSTVER